MDEFYVNKLMGGSLLSSQEAMELLFFVHAEQVRLYGIYLKYRRCFLLLRLLALPGSAHNFPITL